MSNSPISSSRIDSKDESWLLLLSDPSAEKAKMRSKLVFFSCCTLMTMIPAIAALVLYIRRSPVMQSTDAPRSLLTAGERGSAVLFQSPVMLISVIVFILLTAVSTFM